jgi:hypothetical protein
LRNHVLLVLLLISLILSGCYNPLPDPPANVQSGTVVGTAEDSMSGLPLWEGKASLGGQSVQISNGSFQFKDVAPGTYTLSISTQFYKPWQQKVVVGKSETALTAKLTPIFSSAELDLFARLVHAEAKGESYEGQVAVAATVLNRLLHPDYPDTLSGVINHVVVSGGRRYYQYEPVLNGAIKTPANETAKNAVADALAGWDPSRGATGFFAPKKVGANSWVWSRTPTITIGNHRFFK